MKNFSKYLALADDWYIYDNSGTEYKLVAKSIEGQADILSLDIYNNLNKNE